MTERSWLLTAFDPFLGRAANHSMTVLNRVLELNIVPGLRLYSLILPTEFDRCASLLQAEIRRLQQSGVRLEGVLSIGEGRAEFKIETQANNLDHSPVHADNAGVTRTEAKIFADRAELLPFDFPVERFEIARSTNPGSFVCNHLCARMAVARESDPALPPFGFVHVPRSDLTQNYGTDQCARVILDGLRR